MPAVVTFWQLPEDEKDFFRFLQTTGNILALHSGPVEKQEDLGPLPLASFIEKYNPYQIIIGKYIYLEKLIIQSYYYNGATMYRVPYMEHCTLIYTRANIRDSMLPQSNLCAYWDFPSDDGKMLIKKDQDFVKWGKRILSWVRRATPERLECNGFLYPATRRVRDAVSEGSLGLVLC